MKISQKAFRTFVVACFLISITGFSQDTAPPPAQSEESSKPTVTPEKPKLTPREEAWQILRTGADSHKAEERAIAVRALSLIKGQARAVALTRKALQDPKPEVRASAAYALGELHVKAAILQLRHALEDKEIPVVLAAALALVKMKDPDGYQVYYEILTGERKGTPGLISGQMEVMKDPKKLAVMGLEGGIGFVPYAGLGYTAIKTIIKDDTSPVRAAAAKLLADDPDPETATALAEEATVDKSDLIRAAALDAIARRGDPALIGKIVPAMSDAKESVKYTAAAAVAHLSGIAERRQREKK